MRTTGSLQAPRNHTTGDFRPGDAGHGPRLFDDDDAEGDGGGYARAARPPAAPQQLPLANRVYAVAPAAEPATALPIAAAVAGLGNAPAAMASSRRALVEALQAAGVPPSAFLDFAASTWQFALRAVGVAGFAPFLAAACEDATLREALTEVLREQPLTAREAQLIGAASAALEDSALVVAVHTALLHNSTLPVDARLRQLSALSELDTAAGPALDGALAVRPVSVPTVASRCVAHHDARVRAVCARALADGLGGFAQLAPALKLRYADALCADSAESVREAALPLLFRGSPRTAEEVARSVCGADGAPVSARLVTLLSTAHSAAEIRPALELAVGARDAAVAAAAARAVLVSTVLSAAEKGAAFAALAGDTPSNAVRDAAVEHLVTSGITALEDVQTQVGAPLVNALIAHAARTQQPRVVFARALRAHAVALVLTQSAPSAALCAAVQLTDDDRVEAAAAVEQSVKAYARHEHGARGTWTLPQAMRAAVRLGGSPFTRAVGWLDTCATGRKLTEVPALLEGIAILTASADLTRDQLTMSLSVAQRFVKANRQVHALGITATRAPAFYPALLSRFADPKLSDRDASNVLKSWFTEMEPDPRLAFVAWLERLGLNATAIQQLAALAPRTAFLVASTCEPSAQPLADLAARAAALSPQRRLAARIDAHAAALEQVPAEVRARLNAARAKPDAVAVHADPQAAFHAELGNRFFDALAQQRGGVELGRRLAAFVGKPDPYAEEAPAEPLPLATLIALADAVALARPSPPGARDSLRAALHNARVPAQDLKRVLARLVANCGKDAGTPAQLRAAQDTVAVVAELLPPDGKRGDLSAADSAWLHALLVTLYTDWPAAFDVDGLTHLVVARNSDFPAKLVAAPIHQVGANGAYLTVKQPIAVDLDALAALEATGVDLSSVDVLVTYTDYDRRTGSLEVSSPDVVLPDGAGELGVRVQATNGNGEVFTRAVQPRATEDIRFLSANAPAPEVSLVWVPPGAGAQERVIFRIAPKREDALELRLSDLRAAAAFVQQPPAAA